MKETEIHLSMEIWIGSYLAAWETWSKSLNARFSERKATSHKSMVGVSSVFSFLNTVRSGVFGQTLIFFRFFCKVGWFLHAFVA